MKCRFCGEFLHKYGKDMLECYYCGRTFTSELDLIEIDIPEENPFDVTVHNILG